MMLFRRALAACLLFSLLAVTLPLCADEAKKTAPRRLVSELEAMTRTGMKIVWSDELVPADLEVREEPKAKEPRKRLEEMLAPHGLGVVEGPDHSLRIVRLPPKKERKSRTKKRKTTTLKPRAPRTQQGIDTWLAFDSNWGGSLSSRFLLAAAKSNHERSGFITDDGLSQEFDARERRTETAKLELTREAGHSLTSIGLRSRRIEADYDHDHLRSRWVGPYEPYEVTTFQAAFTLEKDDLAAWVTHRQKFGQHASGEIGLRWQDDPFGNDSFLSPRLAWTWAFEEGTILRASWGRYVQSMRVDELAVEDSDLRTYPAESADLAAISLERSLGHGIDGRLEVWDRRTKDPIPRYENLFDPITLFPGLTGDRIRVAPEKSRASGVDLYLKRSRGRVQGSFGYSWSRAEDLVRGRWEARNWDQRHAATLELDFVPRKAWRFHSSVTYHQGWPTTKLEVFETTNSNGEPTLVAGYRERNGERLGNYLRLDVRLSRSYERKKGDLELFFEVFNLLNRENECCVERFDVIPQGESYTLVPNTESWLTLVPSFGLAYRWR